MRVVIWCDMEGVSGIVHWDQVNAGTTSYPDGQLLYTEDVNAAVRGAKRAGATEIVVVDGHGAGGSYSFNSWIKDRLEPGAEYVMGYRWGCYIEPFQSGFDALLLCSYHAMAGTADGILSHTMSSSNWHEVWINGVPSGESMLAACIAGSFDVPVVFVSGDQAVIREVHSMISDKVVAAQVKKGLGRFTGRCLAADSRALIEEKVFEALSKPGNWPAPVRMPAPVEFKLLVNTPDVLNVHVGKPGVEILDPRVVVSRADTFWDAWNQFWYR